MRKERKGITLIVLVITILVSVILAGIMIFTLTDSNPVEKAEEATFKADMVAYATELSSFITDKKAEQHRFKFETLSASVDSVVYNTKTADGEETIKDIIPSLNLDKYGAEMEIIQGDLFYLGKDKKHLEWVKETGVKYTGIYTGKFYIANGILTGVNMNGNVEGELTIPEEVTEIATGAFCDVTNLTKVIIPATVKKIQNGAFETCIDLEEVVLPDTLTEIPQHAFWGCRNLKKINIPKEVTFIGNGAFGYCPVLDNIVIPSKVKKIDTMAFTFCSKLTSLQFSEGLEELGREAFRGAYALTHVKLPNSLKKVGVNAFAVCGSMQKIEIGSSLESFGDGAFGTASPSLIFTVSPNNKTFASYGGIIYDKDKTQLLAVPNGVSNVVIPSTVKKINAQAFSGVSSLKSIKLPEGLTEIGKGAFSNCIGLTSLNIPKTVTNINGNIIGGCSKLTSLTVDSGNTKYKAVDNTLFTKDMLILIGSANAGPVYTVPEGVVRINEGAFDQDRRIEEVKLPSTLEYMEPAAFIYMFGLKKINVPSKCKDVLNQTFQFCTSLETVVLEEGVENIYTMAFYSCSKLRNLTIPSTVKYISGGSVGLCTGLTNIKVAAGNTVYSNGYNVTNMLFSKDLKTLVIGPKDTATAILPKGIEVLASQSFSCTGSFLSRVVLPDTIEIIKPVAFEYADRIWEVVVPSNIKEIGDGAFRAAEYLDRLVIKRKEGSLAGAPWSLPAGNKGIIWSN